jgi:Carboxypeptidase regulatory-like domain/TonB-dependent Receptor Plug Domain
MNMLKKSLRLALLFLMLTSLAAAQEITGSISGTITDSQGGRIAGATVQVSGNAYNKSITTDKEGGFQLLQVPPGRYTLTVSAANFGTTKQEQLEVVLGRATVTELALKPGQVTEQVVVTGSDALAIDPTNNKIQTSLTEKQIDLTPKGVNFSSVLRVSPATRPEPLNAGFQVDGSSGAENTFVIDGLEVTNFRNGQLVNGLAGAGQAVTGGNNVTLDFVREVQVKTSGFEAEYGGATGGVINVVSKSGGNEWHGNAGFQFESDNLGFGKTRPILAPNASQLQFITPGTANNSNLNPPDDDFTNYYPSFNLGGPIVKDRTWLFAGYAPQFYKTTRQRIFPGPDGTTQDFKTEVRNDFAIVRLDGAITQNLRAFGTYNYNPQRQHGQLLGFTLPTSVNLDQRGGRIAAQNFTYGATWAPTANLVISGRGGRNYLNEKGSSYGIPNATRIRCPNATNAGLGATGAGVCAAGFDNIGVNEVITKDISIRQTFDMDASYVASNFGGRHVFKGGYQFNRISNDVDSGFFSTGQIDYFFGQTSNNIGGGPGELGVGTLTRIGTFGKASSLNQGLYIQDAWQPLSRLTLNLGIRLERETVPTFSATGQEIEFGFGSKPAPRIGGAFDLFGDGRTKVFASYGWFYDRFKYELPRGSFGGDQFLRTFFPITNPNINVLTPADILALPNTLTQNFRVPSNDPSDNRIDPDLDAARLSEFTVGFERELWRNFIVAARYTHKQVDRAIEDVGFTDSIGNENFFIANPGRGIVGQPFADGIPATPNAVREYDAFELRFDRRLSSSGFFNATYTYSRLYGNYSGLASSDEDGRSSPNVNRFFDLPFLGFNTIGQPDLGRLATDRPHVFKFNGGYSLDWGRFLPVAKNNRTDLSLFFTGQSGSPLSTRVNILNAATFLFNRGDLGRTEAFTQTDIGVNHRIRLTEKYEIAFQMNVLNLFDQDNVLSVFNIISPDNLAGANFPDCSGCTDPDAGRVNTMRAIFNGGVQSQILSGLVLGATAPDDPFAIAPDARFGQPNRFQTGRELRLGLKFTF